MVKGGDARAEGEEFRQRKECVQFQYRAVVIRVVVRNSFFPLLRWRWRGLSLGGLWLTLYA